MDLNLDRLRHRDRDRDKESDRAGDRDTWTCTQLLKLYSYSTSGIIEATYR